MTKKEKGTMMTLAAGLAWGISGISGQYLMSHGVHVNLLTSLRLLITGIFLLSLARSKQKEHLVASVEPVSSVFLTVLVLGEIFYPIDLLGMLFIFLAVTLISYKDLIALKKMKRVK
ncbi:TPA: hypothetical protein ACGMPK_000810 [Streptococcus agalactiae]